MKISNKNKKRAKMAFIKTTEISKQTADISKQTAEISK